MDEEKAREVAIQILDEFEELLAAKAVKIPSDDREGREEEACLYASEYYALEDAVVGILVERTADNVRNQEEVPSTARGRTHAPPAARRIHV